MGFKKIRYNDGEEMFELKIKNSDGSFLGRWVFNRSSFFQYIDIIVKKYGLTRKQKDRDLDWAK